jgi:hypothetical protein
VVPAVSRLTALLDAEADVEAHADEVAEARLSPDSWRARWSTTVVALGLVLVLAAGECLADAGAEVRT